jgi:hypothetical protein
MSFRSILSTLIPLVLTLLPTGTAAIEPGATIQNCSSGGNTCSITYPQIYCSADGETHFQDVTVPLTLGRANADPSFRSTMNPEQTSTWIVFPKGWSVDLFRQGVFHTYAGPKRFVSMREGTVTIRATGCLLTGKPYDSEDAVLISLREHSYGKTENAGKWHPSRIAELRSMMRNGHPIFEPRFAYIYYEQLSFFSRVEHLYLG